MKIIKRNGAEETFRIEKIIVAITKANNAAEEAERLNNAVFATYGTCVVLCVTSDTDTANAVIKEYVG